MIDLIAYHGQCTDGFGAAYVAKMKFPNAELLPLDYGTEFPLEKFRGKHALILDWSRKKKEENREIAAVAASLTIMDHHKTQKEVLAGEPYAIFDAKRSGIGLAWDFFLGKNSTTPQHSDGTPCVGECSWQERAHHWGAFPYKRPWWVECVQDRDLWLWKYPNSKEMNAFIESFPLSVGAWDLMTTYLPEDVIRYGAAILRHKQKFIDAAVKQAQFGVLTVWLDGDKKKYSAAVVNMLPMHCSEVGEILSGSADVSITWFDRADGRISFSLRSRGDIDVSRIAKEYGGGGHLNAAGFEMSWKDGLNFLGDIN